MTDLTEQEVWKGMSEFDNEYEVSNLGRFRSLDRVIIRKGSQARIKGRIIKGQQDAYGYVTMTIKNKQVKAHRLVAKYFVENPLNKNQVNHKNGIKNDNRAVNLEWCSHEENMKHLYLTMPFEHKNSKQKRMEREDLIRKLTQFVESRTIEDVKDSWVSAKNILDVLCVKYNKINIPMFYDEWQASENYIDYLKQCISVYESKEKQHTDDAIAYNELIEENEKLKSKLQLKETAYDFDTARLEEENTKLKELLKEWVQFEIEENPLDFTVMSERMSGLANKTKEVLK